MTKNMYSNLVNSINKEELDKSLSYKTDGASIELIAAELIEYCKSCQPTTRVLGNIRAEDIVRMCDSFIRDIKLDKIVNEQQFAQVQQIHDTTIADGNKLFNGIIDGSILPEDIYKSGISEKAYSHTNSLLLNVMLNGHTDAYLDINDINLATQCRKIIFDIITNLRNPLNISK